MACQPPQVAICNQMADPCLREDSLARGHFCQALDTASELRALFSAHRRDNRLADDQNFLHGYQPQRLREQRTRADQKGGTGKLWATRKQTPKKTRKPAPITAQSKTTHAQAMMVPTGKPVGRAIHWGRPAKHRNCALLRTVEKRTGVHHVTVRPRRQVRWDRAHPLGSTMSPSGHAVG